LRAALKPLRAVLKPFKMTPIIVIGRESLPLSVIAKSVAMKQSGGACEAGLLRCCAPANDRKRLPSPFPSLRTRRVKQSRGVRMAELLHRCALRNDDYSCHFVYLKNIPPAKDGKTAF
jgi:hypothetical protein